MSDKEIALELTKISNSNRLKYDRSYTKEGLLETYNYFYQEISFNENEKIKKQIDLMSKEIFSKFKAQLVIEYGIETEEQFRQLFENELKKRSEIK